MKFLQNNFHFVLKPYLIDIWPDIKLINEEFKMIKRVYDNVASINPKFRVLSIGMSDDYNIAIENGSNMIRVGSKIFGKRNY